MRSCHLAHTLAPAVMQLLEAPLEVLWVWLWDSLSDSVEFLLWMKHYDNETSLRVLGSAISHKEWDLENTGAGDASSTKLLYCEGGTTRHIFMVQDQIIFFVLCQFPLNGICQTPQNFDIKSRIHCVSYRHRLTTFLSFLDIACAALVLWFLDIFQIGFLKDLTSGNRIQAYKSFCCWFP